MNNLEINQHLLSGDIHSSGVLPHVEQLHKLPFIFKQEFGLDELPSEPGIIIIRGPRQYGKSTWLEQEIAKTICDYGPGSALYLNGDEIANHNELLSSIRDLINIFPKDANIKRIFIDEITAIVDWQKSVKRLADSGELNDILLITTGSKASDLRHGFERLPGRKGKIDRTNYIFTPISFSEFKAKCAATFGEDLLFAYILSGGSAIGANSLAEHGRIAEYVVNTITDWIYGEFSQTGRSRAHVMAILSAIYKFAPNPVGQAKLARESGLSNNTVAKGYVDLMSDLMLLYPSYQYDTEKEISIFRKECKYHFTNLFFAICMHPQKPRTISELKSLPHTAMGSILEWLVAQEIWRQSYIGNRELDYLNFWQNSEHEIDFLIPGEKSLIEVKSGSEQLTDYIWFTKYMKSNQQLTVVNKSRFDSARITGITFEDFLLSDIFK